ncbi:MAG: coenzyme F420-0:L-glutamate ligase [Thermoleophilaceae bacterium]
MTVTLTPLRGVPEVRPGDDLGAILAAAAPDLRDGDVLVVAQKVVSKAEGRVRALADVEPGDEARALAGSQHKDPRLVQIVLDETARLLRAERGLLICVTRHGFVCANAGVDLSNAPPATAVLLPDDPDASARRIRQAVGKRVGVVISDSFGRPWRLGQTDVAIGAAGIRALDDWRGKPDIHGRNLQVTEIATADELAAAADLARTKTSREPAILIRGMNQAVTEEDGPGAATLRRPRNEDLFL